MKSPSSPARSCGAYLFERFRLDPARHQLLRDGELVSLPTRKAFETLTALVEHRDRLVSKEELLSLVWPDTFVSDDSLTQCISMVRRALDDDSANARFIATVPRKGYQFIAPVVEEPGAAATGGQSHAVVPVSAAFPASSSQRASARRIAAIAATIALVAATAVALRPETPASVIRLTHNPPAGTSFTGGGVLSPDGEQIAFIARSGRSGLVQLWVRALDSRQARVIAGTERATRPFWSPDGRAVAFFADGKLKRVDLDSPGGVARPPQVIATTGYAPAGGSWGSRGEILFATRTSLVFRVPADGGEPRPATHLDLAAREIAHRWPQFLPDGRHFLYVAASAKPERAITYVASLERPKWRAPLLDDAASPAFFAGPNHLLFVHDRVLMAQLVDLRTFALEGRPVAITSDVDFPTLTNGGVVSAAGGLLAVWGGPADRRLSWFKRTGERAGSVEAPTALHNPAFSPDDRYLLAQGDTNLPGIWLVNLERGAPMNLDADGVAPTWGRAGQEVAFSSNTPAGWEIHVRQLAAAEDSEHVAHTAKSNAIVADWSVDGHHLLYSVGGTGGSRDVWVCPLEASASPRAYLDSPANEVQSRISPDGRWVAYASDESGSWQVYVQSFPAPGIKRVISATGGAEPQWRRDGRELFYVAPDGTMMAVEVTSDRELQVGAPKPLFRTSLSGDISSYRNRYAVTSDGARFLIDGSDEPYVPIDIIVNWTGLLED